MMQYKNMISRVTIGKVLLNNISGFEINENILEISDTAKLMIPRNYNKFKGKSILDIIKVGDKVKIESGYFYKDDIDIAEEFVGYVQEIETGYPLIIHCEDESYVLRQTNFNLSYRSATLKQILLDIIPKHITVECPDMNLGKYIIDNKNAYTVLQDLIQDYGLYSRLSENSLKVGLAYEFGGRVKSHVYEIGKYPIKQNDLKYKRKRDFKIRFKAIANNPDGTKTTVEIGSKDADASERTLNFIGPMTKEALKKVAEGVAKKVIYDGYSGSITGKGMPRTHAGDALIIKNVLEKDMNGKYMIEKVVITYNENSGFSRKNTLSFKL